MLCGCRGRGGRRIRCSRLRGCGRRGRCRRARVDQLLLQLTHIVFKLDHGVLRLFAEIAVRRSDQKALFDQLLLKPLRRIAVFAHGKLRIEGRGNAQRVQRDVLIRPCGQIARFVRLGILHGVRQRLMDRLGKRLGRAAGGSRRFGHDLSQQLLNAVPVNRVRIQHIERKFAAEGDIVYRDFTGDIVRLRRIARGICIFRPNDVNFGHVVRIHQFRQVCLPFPRIRALFRLRDIHNGRQKRDRQYDCQQRANFFHHPTSISDFTCIDDDESYFVAGLSCNKILNFGQISSISEMTKNGRCGIIFKKGGDDP